MAKSLPTHEIQPSNISPTLSVLVLKHYTPLYRVHVHAQVPARFPDTIQGAGAKEGTGATAIFVWQWSIAIVNLQTQPIY